MTLRTSHKPTSLEGLSSIPEHWQIERTDWFLDLCRDAIKSKELSGQQVFHYSIPAFQEIGDGKVEDGSTIESDKLLVRGEELLVSKLNPRKGAVLITATHDIPAVCSGEFLVLRPTAKADLRYSYYLFLSHWIRERVSSSVQSATRSHQRANPDDIYKIWNILPPLQEQKQISSFLDRKCSLIDSVVKKKQRMIELLAEERQAIINEAVTRGINPNVKLKPSGIEWIGDVPEHWTSTKLSRHSRGIGDGLHGTPAYSDDGEYWFINGTNLDNGGITINGDTLRLSADEAKKYSIALDEATVLISINGTIGKLAIYDGTPVVLGKSAAYIRCSDDLLPSFLYFVLQSHAAQTYYRVIQTGTTIYNLSLKSLREFPLFLPDVSEQAEIIQVLHERTSIIDTQIDLVSNSISLLQEYRTALITEAVTGKLDIPILA